MSTPASRTATASPRIALGGIGLAAIGAIAASGKAIIVKLGLRHGVDATTLLALRMLMALPLFVLMALWAARRAEPLSWADRARVLWLGFTGYYLSSLLDFQGLQYISVTLERLILYLNPTLVLLINVLLARQRPGRWQIGALVLSYLGVLLAFGHDLQREGGQIIVGSLLVLGSALSYALYLFGSGQVVARIGAVRLTAYASCVASVLVLLHFAVTHPLPLLWQAPAPVQWLSLVNATVCTVLPVLAIMLAVQRVGSSLAAQVGMLGPVSTIVMSLWLLDEPMGPAQIAGTVLVLIGVLLGDQAAALTPEQARARILAVIRAIPAGQVMGYGQVAMRAGLPGRARLTARILGQNDDPDLPWHRVLRSDGRIAMEEGSAGWREQSQRLRAEGVVVESGRVRMPATDPAAALDAAVWGPG